MIISPLGTPLKNTDGLCAFAGGAWLTYKDLYFLADYYSSLICPGSVSLIVGGNLFNVLAFYLACLSSNSPVILLPNTLSKTHFSRYLFDFKPRQIFNVDTNFIADTNYKQIDEYFFTCNDVVDLDEKLALPALLLPTSGSTGTPKLVKVSFDNLRANTISIINYLSIDCNSRHICTLPFSYTYGLSCLNTHISVGGSLILNDYSVIDKNFWDLVSNLNPTTLSGVPYTYQTLSRFKLEFLTSLPFSKYTQAGGKLSSDLVRHFYEIASKSNAEFVVMYGQTEATARMSYLPFDSLPRKAGSIGIAIPSGSFTIDLINDLPSIGSYACGELIYHGPNVTHGYATSINDLYLNPFAPTSLKTGDIAYKDSDGFYYIVGRISRFAKVDGIRISLDDLEAIAGSGDIACISDDKYIYIFYSSDSDPDEILISLKSGSSLPSRVFRLIFLDSIPRNDSGKIAYSQLNPIIS